MGSRKKKLKFATRSSFWFPSLKKRGQGRFLSEVRRELFSETPNSRTLEIVIGAEEAFS